MDSNAYTVTMQGQGGDSDQYLFVLFGFGSSTDEPINEGSLMLAGAGK